MIQELYTLLKTRESGAAMYVRKVLEKFKDYKVVVKNGQYIVAIPKGTCTPVALVVHLDTVRSYEDHPVVLHRSATIIRNENGVLGGDDRCGVGIVLNIARRMKALPYLIFTSGEECGCIGAKQLVEDKVLDPYLKDIYAFIEYDRRGHNEVVTYDTRVPLEFKKIFLQAGYETHSGSNSDVAVLTKAYAIAHVNLSAGFYRQHTYLEFVNVYSYLNAITTGLEVLPKIDKLYMLDPPVENTATKYSTGGSSFRIASAYAKETCACCGKDTYTGTFYYYAKGYLCPSCEAKIKAKSISGGVDLVAFTKVKKELIAHDTSVGNPIKAPVIPTLKDVPGLDHCPVCGSDNDTVWNPSMARWECYKCGIDYYIDNGDKVVYYLDNNVGYIELRTPAVPKESSIEDVCMCGARGDTYPVYIPGSGKVRLCKRCLNAAHACHQISTEEYKEVVNNGMTLAY